MFKKKSAIAFALYLIYTYAYKVLFTSTDLYIYVLNCRFTRQKQPNTVFCTVAAVLTSLTDTRQNTGRLSHPMLAMVHSRKAKSDASRPWLHSWRTLLMRPATWRGRSVV